MHFDWLFLQQEAVNSLRKSQSLYVMRKQEYEKAREQSSKVESDLLDKSSSSSALSKMDKRKKVEEDAMHKVRRTKVSSTDFPFLGHYLMECPGITCSLTLFQYKCQNDHIPGPMTIN